MKLAYRAYDKTGREVTDVIDAPTVFEATDTLHRQDLFVAEIASADDAPSEGASPVRAPRSRAKRLKHLAMFTRQLYVLVQSGTPLAQALRALERQARDEGWRGVIEDVRTRLEKGASLSDAMRAHPTCFDSVYRSMIAAGESSGKLPTMLDRLAALAHKRLHIRSAIAGAMVYPCLLVTIATGALTVLLLFIIPRFAELFESLDVPLPPTTAALIGLSDVLRGYWWAFGGGVLAAIAAGTLYLRTPSGRRARDTFVLRVPQIGRIVQSFATARIIRLLGILLDSHLPALEALELTRDATVNVHYRELMIRAEDAVARGDPISSAFGTTSLISPAVYEATRSGERSGQVGPLLLNLADFLDEENDVVLRALTSIIEPAILVLMGLVVGFVAVSMFMPLFDVTAMSGGGAR